MSKLFHFFGGKKEQSEVKISEPTLIESENQSQKTEAIEDIEESFSSDALGQKLSNFWNSYKSSNIKLKDDFTAIMEIFLEIYSDRIIIHRRQDTSIDISGHSKSQKLHTMLDVKCHPIDFVDYIFHFFKDSIYIENQHAAVDTLQLFRIFPSLETISEAEWTSLIATRNQVLLSLQCLAVFCYWPLNIKHLLDKNQKKFYSTLSIFAFELLKIEEEVLSFASKNNHPYSTETLKFILRLQITISQILSNCLLVDNSEFDDSLSSQPWSLNEINKLTHSIPFHKSNHRLFTSESFPFLYEKLKPEFFQGFIEVGCFQYLFELPNFISKFFALPSLNSHLDLVNLILLVLAESSNIFLFSSLVLSPALMYLFDIASYLKLLINEIVSNDWNAVDASENLLIRNILMILRINSIRMAKVDPNKSMSNLNALDMSKIFLWVHHTFQMNIDNVQWIQDILSQDNNVYSLEYKTTLIHTDVSHDLWPWNLNSKSLEPAISQDNSVPTNYHTTPKSTRALLQSSLKYQLTYILWDNLITEILGSQFLSSLIQNDNYVANNSPGRNIKVNKMRLKLVFQSFYELFRNSNFSESVRSNNDNNIGYLPFSQIKFVEFISQMFKAADTTDIFDILNEFEAFRMLLGENFLLSHRYILNQGSILNLFDKYAIESKRRETFINFSEFKDPKNCYFLVWQHLFDSVIDYFHGLVIYSLYFQSSNIEMSSYISYEEIMLIITQYLISLSKNYLTDDHLVYQLSKLLINLNDIVFSMAIPANKKARNEFISHLLEILENLVKYQNTQDEPQRSPSTSPSFTSKSKAHLNYIRVAAGNTVMELLLQYINANDSNNDNDWIDMFLQDDRERHLDPTNEFQFNSLSNPVRRRSMSNSSKSAFKGFRDKSESFASNSFDNREKIISSDKLIKVRTSIGILYCILSDKNLSQGCLYLIQSIVVACAEEISLVEKLGSTSEDLLLKGRKLNLRILAAETLNVLLQYISVSHKHPNISFSVELTQNCFASISHLLRAGYLHHLRLIIQETIRRENLLYEILRASARCLNGFDNLKTKLGLLKDKEHLISLCNTSELVRYFLVLITSIVQDNEACKNTLSLLLRANREKLGSSRSKSNNNIDVRKDSFSYAGGGLTSLILCGEKVPSLMTIIVMLDLILDGPFAGASFKDSYLNSKGAFSNTDEDRPKIKNIHVLPDFFQLVQFCEEETQNFALTSFINLISGKSSLINLNVCSTARPKVLDLALTLFPNVPDNVQSLVAELVELLGRHNISVASLKHLFRSLQQSEGLRPKYSWKVIQALQGMFQQEIGPKHTFVFDGFLSGLKLPMIYKWPTLKGFSFCCWIRLEITKSRLGLQDQSHSPGAQAFYNPYIFCFRDKSGAGIELFLKPTIEQNSFKLVLKTYNEAGETSTLSPDSEHIKLQEGVWQFIGLSLSSKHFYNKGEACFVLNNSVSKSEFHFSKLPDRIPEPIIGNCPVSFQLKRHNHTLRGQMGAIYFFSESLSESILKSIYSLGSDYIYNFEPFSADYKEIVAKSRNNLALSILEDGQLTSKILLTYNPVVLRGKYFLDNTPEKNEILWKVPNDIKIPDEIQSDSNKFCKMHAMRLTGTFRSTTQDVRLALNSLGGVKAIIPLFSQVDQRILPNSQSFSDSNNKKLAFEANFFPAVLGLFTTMIEDSVENCKNFYRCGGFGALRNLFDRYNELNFNLISLNQFIAIFSKLEKELVLQESCLEHVLCNFKLWNNSNCEVQLGLFDWLISYIQMNQSFFPSCLFAQRLIDSLYLYYDYSPIQHKNDLHSNSTHGEDSPANFKFEIALSSLPESDLCLIRKKIFQLIKISVLRREATINEDISSLIRYLSITTNIRAKSEVLDLLIEFLNNPNENDETHVKILITLLNSFPMSVFFSLLELNSDLINISLFKVITKLIIEIHKSRKPLIEKIQEDSSNAPPSPSHGLKSKSSDDRIKGSPKHQTTRIFSVDRLPKWRGSHDLLEGTGIFSDINLILDHLLSSFFETRFSNPGLVHYGKVIQTLLDLFEGVDKNVVNSLFPDWYEKEKESNEFIYRTFHEDFHMAFPFIYFLILKTSIYRKVDIHARVKVVNVLVSLLTLNSSEILMCIPNWPNNICFILNGLFGGLKYDMSDKMTGSLVSTVFQITFNLINFSIKLGKSSEIMNYLPSKRNTLSQNVLNEFALLVSLKKKTIGGLLIKDIFNSAVNIITDERVLEFVLCSILITSLLSLRDLHRIYHSSQYNAEIIVPFMSIMKQNLWLIGELIRDFFDRILSFPSTVISSSDKKTEELNIENITNYFSKFYQQYETQAEYQDMYLVFMLKSYIEFFYENPPELINISPDMDLMLKKMISLQYPYTIFPSEVLVLSDVVLSTNTDDEFYEYLPVTSIRLLLRFGKLIQYRKMEPTFNTSQENLFLQVMQSVRNLIEELHSKNEEVYQFEMLHFIGSWLAYFKFSPSSVHFQWLESFLQSRGEVVHKLLVATLDFINRTEDSDQEESRLLAYISNILGKNMSASQCRSFMRYSGLNDINDENLVETDYELFLRSNEAMLFPESIFGDTKLQLKIWREFSYYFLKFASFMEEELMIKMAMELGLRDQILIIDRNKVKSHSCSTDGLAYQAALNDSEEFINLISSHEFSRMKEIQRLLENSLRKSELKWSRIFSQLANERGPWGYGAESSREVYWTLDFGETNLHTRLKLKRNPYGSRHMVASLKSKGKDNDDENVTMLAESGNLSGIYADLKRFKKTIHNESNYSIKGSNLHIDSNEMSEGEEEHPTGGVIVETTIAETDTVSAPIEIITPATNSSGGRTIGRIEITKNKISFFRAVENKNHDFTNKTGNPEFMWAVECFPSTSWLASEICGVYRRYYQLRFVAIEIFFTNRTNIFFNLFDKSSTKKIFSFLTTKFRAPNLNTLFLGKPKIDIHKVLPEFGLTVTQAWVHRKISNFEYLMYLNFIAGRTFNDLAQYPVFPWVISDYTSSKIDLRDPKIYRRLDLPMGAQVKQQKDLLKEKYDSCLELQEEGVFPYHTGSHYSTSAMVVWYLLRLEPFTSYHVWLQDGKFDRPDRLFFSIDHTFRGCTTNTQDVKELIPEFFYNPEFLYNTNQCSFGETQNHISIDDVHLPPWCRDAPDFVRINRAALESEYVSDHLHKWIDLIFGSKQRPPFLPGGSDRTVDSFNVFVHLSYLDAVDLDSMKETDPSLYARTIRQIDCYGQTPCQLFSKDHPRRKRFEEIQDLIWPIASAVLGSDTILKSKDSHENLERLLEKPSRVLCYGEFKISNSPILFLSEFTATDKLVTIDSRRTLGFHVFQSRPPDNVPPFFFKIDKIALNQSSGNANRAGGMTRFYQNSYREKTVGVPFAAAVVLSGTIMDHRSTEYMLNDLDYEALGKRENKLRYIDGENKSAKRGAKSSSAQDENSKKYDFSRSAVLSKIQSKQLLSALSSPEDNLSVSSPSIHAIDLAEGESQRSEYLEQEAEAAISTKGITNRRERIDEHLSSNLFAGLSGFKLIFSCGHWDNTIKVTAADTGRLIQSLSYHREVVTCIATASDFGKHWLVAGSKDCTVTIWELFPERDSDIVNFTPSQVLYGHDDAVNCLATNAELDLIASGSDDGTIMLHSLRDGTYIRSITFGVITQSISPSLQTNSKDNFDRFPPPPPLSSPSNIRTPPPSPSPASKKQFTTQHLDKNPFRVHMLALSVEGTLIGYSNDGPMLASYTVNGRFLRSINCREKLHALCLSEDGKVILTGGERGLIVLRWVHNLLLANGGPRKGLEAIVDGSSETDYEPFSSPIRSLILTHKERHLIVGLESGEIRILAQDSEYLRRKLHRRLMEIGILSL